MAIIVAYILMVLIGGIALWVVAKLFSGDPPNILWCLFGAGIAEFVSVFNVPFIPYIVLFVVLIKIGGFRGLSALLATMLYGVMKLFLFGTIMVVLTEVIR